MKYDYFVSWWSAEADAEAAGTIVRRFVRPARGGGSIAIVRDDENAPDAKPGRARWLICWLSVDEAEQIALELRRTHPRVVQYGAKRPMVGSLELCECGGRLFSWELDADDEPIVLASFYDDVTLGRNLLEFFRYREARRLVFEEIDKAAAKGVK